MNRFLILFSVLFLIAAGVLTLVLTQNGHDVFDPKMTLTWLAVVAVSLYVSWRIDGILKRREHAQGMRSESGGGFGFLKPKPSAVHSAREARVAARRKKLISEGKLEGEPEPAEPAEEDTAPARVSQSAPIKDRMAARAERVRRAKEQGKL